MASSFSNIANDIANSLWHAFTALDDKNSGTVQKSKLKVLTANIGTVLGILDVEKGLQEYKSKNTLTFEEYLHYLRLEIFNGILSKEQRLKVEEQIDDVCWIICGKKYLRREFSVISDLDVFHMFRIFCMLSERKEDEQLIMTVVMDPEEVIFVWEKFAQALGKIWENSSKEEDLLRTKITFSVFLKLMETKYVLLVPQIGVTEAVMDLYDEFMREVIKKGMLSKKGHVVPNWKDRWFVLKPTCLTYYTSRDQAEKKGEILLNTSCSIKRLSEKPNMKNNRFVIVCYTKEYEISCIDQKTRQQWVTALENAIEYSSVCENFQRIMYKKRKAIRDSENFKKEEEEKLKKHNENELERHKKELELEKMARAEAEARAEEEAMMLEVERKRREELEVLQKEMERLLEEERQAKHDEEIVRALQARILTEESEKREELEKLQQYQNEMLLEERKRRQSLENYKDRQELLLEETRNNLSQLEIERKKVDEELKEAQAKLAVKTAKVKLGETKQIGLARLIGPKVGAIVTHRGMGAFTHAEFGILQENSGQRNANIGEGNNILKNCS